MYCVRFPGVFRGDTPRGPPDRCLEIEATSVEGSISHFNRRRRRRRWPTIPHNYIRVRRRARPRNPRVHNDRGNLCQLKWVPFNGPYPSPAPLPAPPIHSPSGILGHTHPVNGARKLNVEKPMLTASNPPTDQPIYPHLPTSRCYGCATTSKNYWQIIPPPDHVKTTAKRTALILSIKPRTPGRVERVAVIVVHNIIIFSIHTRILLLYERHCTRDSVVPWSCSAGHRPRRRTLLRVCAYWIWYKQIRAGLFYRCACVLNVVYSQFVLYCSYIPHAQQ